MSSLGTFSDCSAAIRDPQSPRALRGSEAEKIFAQAVLGFPQSCCRGLEGKRRHTTTTYTRQQKTKTSPAGPWTERFRTDCLEASRALLILKTKSSFTLQEVSIAIHTHVILFLAFPFYASADVSAAPYSLGFERRLPVQICVSPRGLTTPSDPHPFYQQSSSPHSLRGSTLSPARRGVGNPPQRLITSTSTQSSIGEQLPFSYEATSTPTPQSKVRRRMFQPQLRARLSELQRKELPATAGNCVPLSNVVAALSP